MRVLARTLTTAIVGSARALSRSRPTASLSSAPTVKLNDGTAHPQIGFGTYKVGKLPLNTIENKTMEKWARLMAQAEARRAAQRRYPVRFSYEYFGERYRSVVPPDRVAAVAAFATREHTPASGVPDADGGAGAAAAADGGDAGSAALCDAICAQLRPPQLHRPQAAHSHPTRRCSEWRRFSRGSERTILT